MSITEFGKLFDFFENNGGKNSFETHEYYMMSECTSFKLGGPARIAVFPLSISAFKILVAFLSSTNISFKVIGNGTNIVASDSGYDGVLIITKKMCEFFADGETIYAGCGTGLSRIANIAAELSLSGMENLFGIPATVGGAVFMNAGAHGSQISDVLTSAECYDIENDVFVTLNNKQMNFEYRHSICKEKNLVVISATFSLARGNGEEIKRRMKDVLAKRKASQPLELPNAGSIFKRPENNFAGKLIEDAGLKGRRVGDAEVSVKHAGFIVNKGQATSADICNLINVIKAEVFSYSGIMLKCEVEFV